MVVFRAGFSAHFSASCDANPQFSGLRRLRNTNREPSQVLDTDGGSEVEAFGQELAGRYDVDVQY
jgi:hypothetical protein